MLAINKILRGRYRIINQLGNDEAGTVYKAHDNVRDANVALKEISVDWDKVSTVTEKELVKRAFADQAKLLAKVKHESLPQILGFFSEVDHQYLVMELVDGDNASELLAKTKKPLSFSDAANWADQLLDALDYLHTLAPPIVHGNIKPQNVKLTSRGKIKLLDFGVAKSAEAKIKAIGANPDAAALSYSPPEQIFRLIDSSARENILKNFGAKAAEISEQAVDARSDVYALGATLYHLLTMQPPVDSLKRVKAVWSGETDPLPSLNQVNADVPAEVSGFLMKAMEIEPEKRFASATAMREELQTAVQQAKKREAEEAKKREEAAAREILLAEEKKLAEQRLKVEKERLQLEAEQKKQKEAIARQLKEAEAQRLEAEKRAAEAEKRLLEKESKNASAEKSAAAATSFQNSPPKSPAPAANKQKSSPHEYKGLFNEPKKDNKTSRMIPAVAVVILLLGGAVWGIWAWQKSSAVEANQAVSTQTSEPSKKSEPETNAAPVVPQTTAVVAPETNADASVPNTADTSASRSVTKNKPAATTATRPEKQATPAPQTASRATPKPKKAVTVDDLIGDN